MRAKVENCQCWGALIEGHLGSMLVKGAKKTTLNWYKNKTLCKMSFTHKKKNEKFEELVVNVANALKNKSNVLSIMLSWLHDK
jgi:hypothetical protein